MLEVLETIGIILVVIIIIAVVAIAAFLITACIPEVCEVLSDARNAIHKLKEEFKK